MIFCNGGGRASTGSKASSRICQDGGSTPPTSTTKHGDSSCQS